MRDLYAEITDKLVTLLEAGTVPWRRGWQGAARGSGMPHNFASRKPYNGINVVVLWAEAQARGYPSNEWLTFKQCAAAGGQVRKGERGTLVVFYKKLEVEDRDAPGETKKIPLLRGFTVFNVAQCDGLPLPAAEPAAPVPEATRNELCDLFAANTKALIRHGGDRAFYAPLQDYISVPPFAAFETHDGYYATLIHELTHWTGHATRLDRLRSNARFGSEHYAYEELVAELGATFLCAELELTPDLPNHASYLASWLKVLKGDKRAMFRAAADAAKAATHLKQLQPGYAEYVAATQGEVVHAE